MRMRLKASPGVPAMVVLAVVGLLSLPAVAQHGGHGGGHGSGHGGGHVSGGHSARHSGGHRFGHITGGHSARHSVSHLGGHGTLHSSFGHIGAGHVIHHGGHHSLHIGLYHSSFYYGYRPSRRSYPRYRRTTYIPSDPVRHESGTPVSETPHFDDPPPSNSEGIPMYVPLVETLESPEVLPPLENESEEDTHSADDYAPELHVREVPHS